MIFNSLQFIIFFPIVVLLYYIIPTKYRYIWLLLTSYFFYMCWNIKYAFLLLATTGVTYFFGLLIPRIKENKRKPLLIICIALCLSSLCIFKYLGFIVANVNLILHTIGLSYTCNNYSILLPMGISFYTFQSLGYVIDVYREDIEPERNFLRYALFVSFFPQLVAGPIERSKNLLSQVNSIHKFDYVIAKNGFLLMLWGFFEKIIIADRAATLVDTIFANYTEYAGSINVLACIFFAIQIYCDFAGYTHIAIGAAAIMGFDLKPNFRQPYLAIGIKDFWSRWHISLSTWFRDYLYIPLGGNRHGKVVKYRNIFITFLLSGLWHGAAWNYIAWGGIHGLYQVLEDISYNGRCRIIDRFHINKNSFSHRLYQCIITFIFTDLAWLFFRAESLGSAIKMLINITTNFKLYNLFLIDFESLGLSFISFSWMIIAIVILLMVDILHENNISITKWLYSQGNLFRWSTYIIVTMLLIIGAIQNIGQSSATFIYFQF